MTAQALQPINPPENYNKLIAGSTASLVGGALTTVLESLVGAIDPSYVMTAPLQGAIQTLVTLAVTAGAIYLTPHQK
jgi:hypothetical protein